MLKWLNNFEWKNRRMRFLGPGSISCESSQNISMTAFILLQSAKVVPCIRGFLVSLEKTSGPKVRKRVSKMIVTRNYTSSRSITENHTCVWQNILPNMRSIFHRYFPERAISYTCCTRILQVSCITEPM